MPKEQPNRINWIDVETTGLHPSCLLLEAAIVITDNDLNVLGSANAVVCHPPDVALGDMDEWCRKTHTGSGLMAEVEASKTGVLDLQDLFLSLMQTHDSVNGILGGASVHFDRRVLKSWCPRLHDALSYRNFDVTTLKEAVRRWWPVAEPHVPQASGVPVHRAMPDIKESIRQAHAIREMLLLRPQFAGLEDVARPPNGRPYIK